MEWILKPLRSLQENFSSPASSASSLPKQPTKLNDYVYELCKPEGRPSVEVVFFHGFQLSGSKEAFLTTWLSGDEVAMELWPSWIAESFPEARILLISYDGFVRKKDDQGITDPYVTGENLVQSLTDEAAQVGRDGCPVIMVGHCLGGLVMKELLLRADSMVSLHQRDNSKEHVQCLLESLKQLFYYATPHHGSRFADIKTEYPKGKLVKRVQTLNKEAARCNEEFRQLRQKYNWKADGIAESLPVPLGKFESQVLVEEASTRSDVDTLYTVQAHHFDVCRPKSKTDSCYSQLINVIDRALKEDGHGHRMSFSSEVVGLEYQVAIVKDVLKGARRLGIVGTGGMGKSTLAKVVYNSISGDFEYTCFLSNVKDSVKKSDTMEDLQKRISESLYYKGRRKVVDWSRLRGKKVLFIFDDVEYESQVYGELDGFSGESCLLVTSRNQRFVDGIGFTVHKIQLLDDDASKSLFRRHAFKRVAYQEAHNNRVLKFIDKCGGWPLALEATGKYLSTQAPGDVWDEAFDRLSHAERLDGSKEDGFWSVFQVIYEGLANREQQMFLDIATCFQGEELELVKRAWEACSWAKGSVNSGWQNLLDKGLVTTTPFRERGDNGTWIDGSLNKDQCIIQMHEVLRDLGRSIACSKVEQKSTRACFDVYDRQSAWPFNKDKPNFKVRVLKIVFNGGPHDPRPNIAIDSLSGLENLEILWLDGISLSGAWTLFPVNLAFLKLRRCCWSDKDRIQGHGCVRLGGARNFFRVKLEFLKLIRWYLVYLEFLKLIRWYWANLRFLKLIRRCWVNLEFLNLIRWYWSNAEFLKRIRWYLGDRVRIAVEGSSSRRESSSQILRKHPTLRHFEIDGFEDLQHLLQTVGLDTRGQLQALENLKFDIPRESPTTVLPDTFEQIRNITVEDCTIRMSSCSGLKAPTKHLRISGYHLRAIPDTLGELRALEYLEISHCYMLEALPDSLGLLCGLRHLVISLCPSLYRLPSTLGELPVLEHLEISHCERFLALPDTLGDLGALKHLQVSFCHGLRALPDSFGELPVLKHLQISDCNKLQALPDTLGDLGALKHLEVSFCHGLRALPDFIRELPVLEHLEIYYCKELQGLPDTLGKLGALKHLQVSFCHGLQALPDSLGELPVLKHLEISDCNELQALPDTLGELGALKHLEVFFCHRLQALPDSLGELPVLKHLEISDCNELQALPDTLGKLPVLEHLKISGCKELQALPDTLADLGALKHLEVSFCHGLQALPDSLGELPVLKHLEISDCNELQALPETLGKLGALKHLQVSFCHRLQALPDSLGELPVLKYLEISDCNELQALPDTLGELPVLEHLKISGCNELQALPDTLGELGALKHLEVSFCHQLQALPDTLGELPVLEHLKISGCNELQALPDTLGDLGALKHFEVSFCHGLQALPDSLGELPVLEHLEISDCNELQALPDTLGDLGALKHLQVSHCYMLKALPDSLGELPALESVLR